MAVYNGERFLRSAIQSVLDQTFKDFELIIIDDASLDNTKMIVESYKDPRIKLFVNERNRGPGYSRNIGIHNAQGKFIAILDSDDIALPYRLGYEAKYLENHPDISVICGAHEAIDENGFVIGNHKYPQNPISMRWKLLFRNCISHSTVMARKIDVLSVGGYSVDLPPSEDYYLWGKMAKSFKFVQIDLILSQYRIHSNGISRTNLKNRTSIEVVQANIESCIGEPVPVEVAECFYGKQAYTDGLIINIAYDVTWKCLVAIQTERKLSTTDRRNLLRAAMYTLSGLAEKNKKYRSRAIDIVFRYGLNYSFQSLLSPSLLKIIGKSIGY
jgi:glycosyltransferase involved in cell wall biosynthesis